MPIRFECEHCGTKLKAPDGTTGKTTKCLKCARPVMIPEPVYEAEVVDDPNLPEPLGAAEFFDVEDNDPYDVAGMETTKQTGPEQRRPCPMCGEMILVAAAKCRFCGEVFDSALIKTEKSRKKGKVTRDTIVQFRRNIHGLGGIWIFFAIVCWGVALAAGATDANLPNVDPNAAMIGKVVFFTLGVVWLTIGVLACCKFLWSVYVGIVIMYLNTISLLFQLGKTLALSWELLCRSRSSSRRIGSSNLAVK